MTFSDIIEVHNEAGHLRGNIRCDKGGITYEPIGLGLTVGELRDIVNKMVELEEATHGTH